MHLKTRTITFPIALFLVLAAPALQAQRPPQQPHAAEILHRMQKLNVLGSVLYIAAHPDDENTRLIAWLANGKKVRTGYLSLTRGEGGQNLIGPELGDALGIIRTQELLEARRIDGGEQFFTRAVDFGFSKSADESFAKWGKQEVLSDVVRVIRMFRPDIIITRFSTEPGTLPTGQAGTHGHHTASAILAHEAFDLAGDSKAFPEQLEQGLEPWQPRRLFFNGSSWWRRDIDETAKNDPDWFSVDVGGYDPLLGLSYTEIAGRSRSMHKSQGFGAAETRGEMIEYLKMEKGDRPKGKDIFEGIDMTWGSIPHLARHIALRDSIRSAFNPLRPYQSFTSLEALRESIFPVLKDELSQLAVHCLGLSLQVRATEFYVPVGDSATLTTTIVNRSDRAIRLEQLHDHNHLSWDTTIDQVLTENRPFTMTHREVVDYAITQPYWLEKPHTGLYDVELPWFIGYADRTPAPEERLAVGISFGTDQTTGEYTSTDAQFQWVDRVAGERIRPVYVTPVASIEPQRSFQMNGGDVTIEVRALKDGLTGTLEANVTGCFHYDRTSFDIGTMKRDERKTFTFKFIGNDKICPGKLSFQLKSGDQVCDKRLHEIDYPHILPQVYYTPAEVKLVPLDVKTTAKTVGYIKGAGDDVPQAIEQLGVRVDLIEPATATLESISKYDAIVVGIRAYNNNPGMKRFNPVLMRYVENGGTAVVQYTTRTNDMVLPDTLIGPYPFQLTRGRVTVEEAPPTFLDPKHPLLNTPNTITAADFDGWVQERGLYFVGERDPRYTALIAWNDPGEEPLDGALIVCDHGKGRYVYTGISFFRQLPAGVPGAYRLFANLISKPGEKGNEK